MNLIIWTEQDKFYGLDYSTKKGEYKDFTFDIRYDYCGDATTRPKCGCCLLIYFKNKRIESKMGDIDLLTVIAEKYLDKFLKEYKL
ncbi:MAG: hypothetical protein V4547_17650 [Bacteroidota bacterium]